MGGVVIEGSDGQYRMEVEEGRDERIVIVRNAAARRTVIWEPEPDVMRRFVFETFWIEARWLFPNAIFGSWDSRCRILDV